MPTKLGCRPVDHRFEETRWEWFEADILVCVVSGNLKQVVRSVWVNLNGVIPKSRLIQDLPDRTHIRFDTRGRIKLAKYRQQRGVHSLQSSQSLQGRQRVVDIKAPHVSPEGIVTALRPPNIRIDPKQLEWIRENKGKYKTLAGKLDEIINSYKAKRG